MTDYPNDNRSNPSISVDEYKQKLEKCWKQKTDLSSQWTQNEDTKKNIERKNACNEIYFKLIATVKAIEKGRKSSLSLKAATRGILRDLDITAASIFALHSCHHELEDLVKDSGESKSPELIEKQKKELFEVLKCIQQVNNPQKSAPLAEESTWPYIFASSLGVSLINAVQTPLNYIMAAVFIVGICLIVQAATLFPVIAVASIGAYVFGKMAYAAYTAVKDANQFANNSPNPDYFANLHTVLDKELTGLKSNQADLGVIFTKQEIMGAVGKLFKPVSAQLTNSAGSETEKNSSKPDASK